MTQTPTLIEQNKKRNKMMILIGNLFFFGGIAVCISSFSQFVARMGWSIESVLTVGGAMMLLGVVVAYTGKFLAWWQNG